MYAVIKTGGKQYRVQEGDVITVEKLYAEKDDKVEFEQVLTMGEGADLKVGTPFLDGVKVFGTVVENGKGEKVIIFKYKSKKDYRKKQGHRQPYSMVEITGIGTDKGAAPKKAKVEAEAPKQVAEVEEKAEVKEEKAEVKSPSLKSMKKAELIAFAKENNISIDEKATNAVLIETIESALK